MRRVRVGLRGGRGAVALLVGATACGTIASVIVAATLLRGPVSPVARLAAAVGPHRITRARLTGGFAYAPCDSTPPNDSLVGGLICDRTRPDQWREYRALSRFARDLRSPGVEAPAEASQLHAVGGWHLVWSDPDAAIENLRRAAAITPGDASV